MNKFNKIFFALATVLVAQSSFAMMARAGRLFPKFVRSNSTRPTFAKLESAIEHASAKAKTLKNGALEYAAGAGLGIITAHAIIANDFVAPAVHETLKNYEPLYAKPLFDDKSLKKYKIEHDQNADLKKWLQTKWNSFDPKSYLATAHVDIIAKPAAVAALPLFLHPRFAPFGRVLCGAIATSGLIHGAYVKEGITKDLPEIATEKTKVYLLNKELNKRAEQEQAQIEKELQQKNEASASK